MCPIYFPKKPMATHQASINIQEPTKFKLEATRTRVEYFFHLEPNATNFQIRAQFENPDLQIEQELSKHPEFESEPTATKPQVNGSEPWQIL